MTIKNRFGFHTARAVIAVSVGVSALGMGGLPLLANGNASKSVDLAATVPSLCTIGDFDTATLDIAVVDGLPSTDTVSTATTINCNVPSAIRLTSMAGGVMQSLVFVGERVALPSHASGFDYLAEVKSGGATLATFSTADDASFGTQEDSTPIRALDETTMTADMTITLEVTPSLPAGGQTLMSGSYTDQIVLHLLPEN